METAAETQQRLVADFAEFSDDPFSLYEYLLGFSAELPVMPDGERELAALVEGCQSRVWLRVIRGHTGRLTIALDSDTLIVRGVLNAIVQIYSNRSDTFLEQTGLADLFSAERQSGIKAVMAAIRNAVSRAT